MRCFFSLAHKHRLPCPRHPNPTPQDERVAVCSIEKAGVALNKMIAEGRLQELEAVVVDEVHMVADAQRGAALEALLSKLRAARSGAQARLLAGGGGGCG